MAESIPKVFLDANIVISAGKPPGGPELARVVDLVNAGIVTILTTNLTITEVAKKHVLNDFDVIKEICQPHFRKLVEAATGVVLPDMKRAQLRKILDEYYRAPTESMFKGLRAKKLVIDDVKPSVVFAAYAAGEGFFSGEGKKDQFPDAFAFECLKQEASKEEPVIVVSQDRDFVGPTESSKHISIVKSLPQLFATLGLEMKAPEVDQFLDAHNDDLIVLVNHQLSDWGLESDDVMDAEIDEIAVSAVEIKNLTAFKPTEEGDPILVVGTIDAQATVSYTHPNWDQATYDSEDKVLIPFEDVSGETDVEVSIDISMSISLDGNRDPERIEELRFRNDDFQYVTLHPPDEYK